MKAPAAATLTLAVTLGTLALGPINVAFSQDAKPQPPPFSKECLDEAKAQLTKAAAFHDGSHKSGLALVTEPLHGQLQAKGVVIASLCGVSTLTPASAYALVELKGEKEADSGESCPLHRTYLMFRQGGFNPQDPSYYGPLRRAGA